MRGELRQEHAEFFHSYSRESRICMDADGRVGVLENEYLCEFFSDCKYFLSEVGRKVIS